MQRFYQSFSSTVKPQTAPVPISERHVAPMGLRSLPPTFAAGDTFTAPPKIIPAIVAAVTLAMWTPTAAPPAMAVPHQQGPSAVAPEKSIVAASPVSLAGWTAEVSVPGKVFRFSLPEGFAAPVKTIPPAPVTLNHWTPTIATSAVGLPIYQRGDIWSGPPTFAIFVSPFTTSSWLGEVAGPAKRFTFAPGDLAAPPKLFPPAAITLNHWSTTDGTPAARFAFSQPDGFAAPAKFAIVSASPITLANWMPNATSTAAAALHVFPPATAAPEKVLTSPSLPTVASWFRETAAVCQPARFAAAVLCSPEKIFALSSIGPTICAQAARLGLAVEALAAQMRPAIEAQTAKTGAAMEALAAQMRPAIEALNAETRVALEAIAARVVMC